MDDPDGTLEAIVAHGLIGSLAVATGSASMLLGEQRRPMAPATEEWLLDSIAEQSILVVEGMRSMLGRTTTSFLDAATKLSLAAGSLRSLPAAARRPVLETLLSASTVLRDILGGLVRGLPQEIVMMLDELSAGHPSPSPA